MQFSPFSEENLNRRQWINAAAGGAAAGLIHQGRGFTFEQQPAAKQLLVHSHTPLNAEPELSHLVESWQTPVKHFYVRSHAPVPEVDRETFRLKVQGMVHQELSLSMDELDDRIPATEVTATLTCAGNRRREHSLVRQTGGLQWAAGPIGNARWGGVRLADVLRLAGLKSGAKHVWFESVDRIEKKGHTFPFGASIPMAKALEKTENGNSTLLATTMNGLPLPPDHGFPVRTVVPGYVGARSVKWLGRIVVSDRPSENHYVANAYKLVVNGDPGELSAAPPVYAFPINSAICLPGAHAKLVRGELTVRGYALPPGESGRTISRVEISTDGGHDWHRAALLSPAQEFCWRLWQATVPLNSMTKQLIVRAVDSNGIVQPETVDWNLKGYLYNAWYHLPVQIGT
ncbi:MAG: molybdopterin-dependent oxidoreductase [Fuerstiella sp.]|nr:molybdopterin-dependent oxidoreductase [Fuerstiella sp.]